MYREKILNLTKRLLPKGRAFRTPFGSSIEKMHKGLAVSESQAYSDALSVLDSILPDNNNFTTADAADWEYRLGLITNTSVSLADRKAAILRKMNHPGTIEARQHYLYLERELQAAGFNVWVHENIFQVGGVWTSKSPEDVSVNVSASAVHRGTLFHGQVQHGAKYGEKIANSIDPYVDRNFSVGQNYKSTFFIGGQVLGDLATIQSSRVPEFRQLVLKIKPVQTVAYLFLDYDFNSFNSDFNNDFNIF